MSQLPSWSNLNLRFRMQLRILAMLVCVSLVAAPANGQTNDITRLIHPDVADKLSLTDAQRAEIQKNIQDKTTAVAAATEPTEKAKIASEFDQKTLAQLTDEQ